MKRYISPMTTPRDDNLHIFDSKCMPYSTYNLETRAKRRVAINHTYSQKKVPEKPSTQHETTLCLSSSSGITRTTNYPNKAPMLSAKSNKILHKFRI